MVSINGGRPDRRAWLIISRSEAEALVDAAIDGLPEHTNPLRVPGTLGRALRIVEFQLRWIDGAADGNEPTVEAAVRREARWQT